MQECYEMMLKIMHHLGHNTLIGNAEDLDIVMLMYNLLEYNTSTSIQPPVSPEEDQAPQPPIQP